MEIGANCCVDRAKFGNTTTRLQVEFNWFPTQPDLFGPEYFIAFNITPVVNNPFQKFFN